MLKLKVVLLLAFVMTLSACEDGSYFDNTTRQLKSDAVGRIEATGWDLRVYEFTPQTDPSKQCIFAAGDKKGGLVCWDKKEK